MSSTLCLIRQDPARSGLLRAVAISLAIGLLMRVVPDLGEEFTRLSADNLPGGFAPMYLVFTALVATFVLGANAWTRSSRLALGLPLSTRRVWAVRIGSLAAVALLSIGALAAVTGLSFDLETRRLEMNAVVFLAAARAAATSLLLICLYQLPQSERDRIPIDLPYVVYIIGATLLTLLFSAAQITSMAGTLILLAIVVALGLYLWRRVPSTFSAGPTVEESETPLWSMPDERDFVIAEPLDDKTLAIDQKRPSLKLHGVLFRGLKANLLAWIFLIVVGVSAAVVTAEFLGGTNAFLPLFFLVVYSLPVLQTAVDGMAPFDPLPIPRRLLWAHSVGPMIVSIALGAGVSMIVFLLNPQPFTQVNYEGCCVRVPWDYLEITRSGHAPTITAAWGESSTPRAHPLWRGRSIALYDPFEVGPESSPRFAELQLRRAVEKVYGISIPTERRSVSYKIPAGLDDSVERGTATLDEIRGRMSSDRNRSAAVALLLLTVFGTTVLLTFLLQFGSSVHHKVFKRASIGFFIILGVIAVAVSAARLLGFTEIWYVGALMSIGVRSLAHSIPLPTPILWFLCVTFWVGAYLILERIFSTIEFPREKTMNRFAEEY